MPASSTQGPSAPIHVAAAAVMDRQGRILISKRHAQAHQGGLWEFPGGKLEAGETPLQGLARELREELNIEPLQTEPLIRITHHYRDRSVLLDVYRVPAFRGEPRGMEGQPLAWLYPQAMRAEEFPAADRPIITALCLPDLYLITGPDPARPDEFLQRLQASVDRGLRLVQLRAHELADPAYVALARSAREICRAAGAQLLLNRATRLQTWADGVHLSRHQLLASRQRPSVTGWVGASCHDMQELRQAQRLGLDYVLLSPVLATGSHPGVSPLGWERFAAWVAEVNLPVYALGGMDMAQLPRAKGCGAQGIAAISGLWGTQPPNP